MKSLMWVPLAALSVGSAHAAGVQTLRSHHVSIKEYPVSKVVNLLRDMKEELEKEADADEELYDKLACWCETNDKEKTKAIADAEQHLIDLQATIERLIEETTGWTVEIEGLEKEVAENHKALEAATAMRAKEEAEFTEEEKEMLEAIKALTTAVEVLSKHHTNPSFLDQRMLSNIALSVKNQMRQHADLLQGTLSPSQESLIESMAQGNVFGNYEPQSGQIFGILSQMKETFENNLSQAQSEEKSKVQAFTDVKAAKEEEILTGDNAIKEKKQLLANGDETIAQSKQDREDTTAALTADERFMIELKKKCSMTDAEWEERQKLRQTEINAIAKALEILTTDEARTQFSETLGFFQQKLQGSVRNRAASVLAAAAARSHNAGLSKLAAAVRIDAFARVLKAIDDMVSELVAEKADEIEHRDYCVKGLNENERTTAKKAHEKGRSEQQVEALTSEAKELGDAIADLESQINQMKESLVQAKVDREAEQELYETTLQEQKDTETLLQKALDALKEAYASPNDAAFMQRSAIKHQTPAPAPEGFSEYRQHEGGTGVVMMIEQIITDTQNMQNAAKKDNQAGKDAYTAFKEETTKTMETKADEIVDKTGQKSKTDQELVEEKEELGGLNTDLEDLSSVKNGLHGECDYIMKNFDARQEARDQEVDALRQAKAILKGMKVTE